MLVAAWARRWPRSAAGATRARRRRSAVRSSSSRSTRCAPTTCRSTATRDVQDAGHRRARRRRRRLRAGVLARAADAAGARVAPVRPAAVRDRRPRQRRLRRQRRASGCSPRCCAIAATRPAASCRRSCCARRPASARASRSSTTSMPPARPASRERPVQRDGAESEAIAERWLGTVGTDARVPVPPPRTSRTRRYAPPIASPRTTPYDGEIAYADEIVGRLVRYLKAHQLYDQSTIILRVGSRRRTRRSRRDRSTGCSSTTRRFASRSSSSRRPAKAPAGASTTLVQHVDLVPTILDLAKAPVPGNLRGRSLEAAARRHERASPNASCTRSRCSRAITSAGAADDRHRRALSAGRARSANELYDLLRRSRRGARRSRRTPG